jgi:hypothetical protein
MVLFDLLETTEGEQVVVLHEVHQATGGGNEDVATHLELLALVLGRSTTVDDARAQHRAVTETTSLVKDLEGVQSHVCLTCSW